MHHRLYINENDLYYGDFNIAILNNQKEIEYSFWCSGENDFPPSNCGYKLVYESEKCDFTIKRNPYNIYE